MKRPSRSSVALRERCEPPKAIFAEANAYRWEKDSMLHFGTPIDATIVDTPASTENEAEA